MKEYVVMQDVLKRYGSFISVDHVNIAIRQGEIFGLLGPNGAGKSTLIKMLCGLLRIDRGSITVGDLDVVKHTFEVKKSIGLVPQDLAIYEKLTAEENVTYFARLYGLRGHALKESVKQSLDFVGLYERRNQRPVEFSGGMKRRLNIACAITHRPQLVIMDEPTVGIDPQSRNHILESVRTLHREGATIIYTSHYMEEVEAISHRVGILDHGRFIACGTLEELRKEAGEQEKLTLTVNHVPSTVVDALRQHPQILHVNHEDQQIELVLTSSQAFLQDILFILSEHGVHLQSLKREEPHLEMLFLKLTGRSLRD